MKLRYIIIIFLASLLFSGCQLFKKKTVAMYDDRIIGWYKLSTKTIDDAVVEDDDTLVPILKRNKQFYTICRGFEMPLNTCSAGLEWGFTPSSMEGTMFVFCGPGWPCHLKIYDRQKAVFDWYEPGKKYKLIKVAEPEGLSYTVESAPENSDGFIGIYQPVYFPWMRVEISKEADKYNYKYSELRIVQEEAKWIAMGMAESVLPLDEAQGFLVIYQKAKNYLLFSKELSRFEVIIGSTGLRMPMVKLTSSEETPQVPKVNLGIPSWN